MNDGEAGVDLPTVYLRFDALIHEVAHRLHGGDPVLARTLLRARDAIWQGLTRR